MHERPHVAQGDDDATADQLQHQQYSTWPADDGKERRVALRYSIERSASQHRLPTFRDNPTQDSKSITVAASQ